MKQKIFYMLAIICCISFFSDAKQKCKNHDISVCKCISKKKLIKKDQAETGYDVSPMRFLIFTI
jgi:hypothetical protein